jgi:hypothetical protein
MPGSDAVKKIRLNIFYMLCRMFGRGDHYFVEAILKEVDKLVHKTEEQQRELQRLGDKLVRSGRC